MTSDNSLFGIMVGVECGRGFSKRRATTGSAKALAVAMPCSTSLPLAAGLVPDNCLTAGAVAGSSSSAYSGITAEQAGNGIQATACRTPNGKEGSMYPVEWEVVLIPMCVRTNKVERRAGDLLSTVIRRPCVVRSEGDTPAYSRHQITCLKAHGNERTNRGNSGHAGRAPMCGRRIRFTCRRLLRPAIR